jgi:hypothetical protein
MKYFNLATYNASRIAQGCMRIASLSDKEIDLCQAIYSLCPKGQKNTFIKSDMTLEQDIKIIIGFYDNII